MFTSLQSFPTQYDYGFPRYEAQELHLSKSAGGGIKQIEDPQVDDRFAWESLYYPLVPHDIDPFIYLRAKNKDAMEKAIVHHHLSTDLIQQSHGESPFSKWVQFPSAIQVMTRELDSSTVSTCFPNFRSAEFYVQALSQKAHHENHDIPRTDEQQRVLVGILKQAFQSLVVAIDHPDILETFRRSIHDPRIVEYHCWKLLHAMVNGSQRNLPVTTIYGSIIESCRHDDDKFFDLFDATRYALQTRKTLCLCIIDCLKVVEIANNPSRTVNKSLDSDDMADHKQKDVYMKKGAGILTGPISSSTRKDRIHNRANDPPAEPLGSPFKKRKLSQGSEKPIFLPIIEQLSPNLVKEHDDPTQSMSTGDIWQLPNDQNGFEQICSISLGSDGIYDQPCSPGYCQRSDDCASFHKIGSFPLGVDDPDLNRPIQIEAYSSTSASTSNIIDTWLSDASDCVSNHTRMHTQEQTPTAITFDIANQSPALPPIDCINPAALIRRSHSTVLDDSRLKPSYACDGTQDLIVSSDVINQHPPGLYEAVPAVLDHQAYVADTSSGHAHVNQESLCESCLNLYFLI